MITVKLRAVDWAAIHFWTLFGQKSQYISIKFLKILGCAANQDVLLLVTLR